MCILGRTQIDDVARRRGTALGGPAPTDKCSVPRDPSLLLTAHWPKLVPWSHPGPEGGEQKKFSGNSR